MPLSGHADERMQARLQSLSRGTRGRSVSGNDPRRLASREDMNVMKSNLKRFTLCLAGHKWAKVGYPVGADGETPGTFFQRCLRCGQENHETGRVARGGGSFA